MPLHKWIFLLVFVFVGITAGAAHRGVSHRRHRHVLTTPIRRGMHEHESPIQTGFPPRRINPSVLSSFLHAQRANQNVSGQISSVPWMQVASTNFSGRITAIALATNRPDTILIGAADGGVWRSVNGGASFTPVFDTMPTLSIGALAWDPINPAVAYAGTGEANANGDSYPGMGIFTTSDAGATWKYAGLEGVPYISAIVANPANANELFAGGMGGLDLPDTVGGVFHSTDKGATWTKIFSPGDSTGVIDVKYIPFAAPVLLCAAWQRGNGAFKWGSRSGLFRSVDLGKTWLQITSGLPAHDSLLGRIAIAPSLSSPGIVYAELDENHSFYDFGGIYKSNDAGLTWAPTNAPNDTLDWYQGWYDKVFAVNPRNANDLLFGDIDVYHSTDGGGTWANISQAPINTHVDEHAIAYNPIDTTKIFVGNDGGFYQIIYDTDFTNIPWKSSPLPLTQFYSSAIDSLNAAFAMGGTQDNGLLLSNDTAQQNWLSPGGFGDAGMTAVNPMNPRSMICMPLHLAEVDESYDGGNNWSSISNSAVINLTAPLSATPPLFFNPLDSNTIYFATNQVFRTTNGGSDWDSISSIIPFSKHGFITALGCDNKANIFLCGASDGTLALSQNSGAVWKMLSPPFNGWVSSAAVDADAGLLYAGLNFADSGGTLYRSSDLGVTWNILSSLQQGFPPAAVNSIVIDNLNDSTIFIGTDIGVYVSRDVGDSWVRLGTGLPNCAVTQLNLFSRSRIMRAATHGRDMWDFDLGAWEKTVSVHEPLTIPPNIHLSVAPNPASDATAIQFALPSEEYLTVKIYDLIGNCVAAIAGGVYSQGEHSLSWNIAGLPSGAYSCQIVTGGARYVKPLIIAR